MRRVAIALTALTALALPISPALACSPAPGVDQVAERTRGLLAVTSVYEARIEDVVVYGRYSDKVDFTVRPTAAIWGPISPDPYRLSFEAGACTNWFFLMDDEAVDERPRDGLKLVVMANPEGLADNRWLFLVRAGGADADLFMRDWRAARAGQPLSRRP